MRKYPNTTTIRISERAHDKLREMAFNEDKKITDIIDRFCGTSIDKRRNHHSPNEKPDLRKKHVRVRPLTMVEQLLRQK